MKPEKFTIDFDAVITEDELTAPESTDNANPPVAVTTPVTPDSVNPPTDDVELTDEELTNEDLINSTIDSEDVKPTLQKIGSFFKDEGILPDLDMEKFTGDPEELKEAIEAHIMTRASSEVEAYKSAVPEVIKQLLNNWEDDVPLDQLINIKSNQIKYSAITDEKLEENAALQKDIYTKYLKETTKFSDKKISEMVEKAEEEFTLEDLVKKEALPELKASEVEKEKELVKITATQKEYMRKQNEQSFLHYRDSLSKITEIIPGMKFSEEDKKQVLSASTAPVAMDGNNNPVYFLDAVRMKDPAKYDAVVTHLAIKTKGFTDWSKFTTAATTTAAKKLAQDLESSRTINFKPKGDTSSTKKTLTPAEVLRRNFG